MPKRPARWAATFRLPWRVVPSLAEIKREKGLIRDLVATAFRELKRYELIAERRDADRARFQRKWERRTEDELGMSMFRQKRPNSIG